MLQKIHRIDIHGDENIFGQRKNCKGLLNRARQAARRWTAQSNLETVIAARFFERGRNAVPKGGALRYLFFKLTNKGLPGELRSLTHLTPNRYQDHASKWREIKALAKFELLFRKPIKVVVARKLNGWAERRKCLHEHLAFDVPSSRPTCDLSQELKGAFSRPKVGEMQAQIGVNNSDQGHAGKMKAFGDHLSANKNVDRAFFESLKGLL